MTDEITSKIGGFLAEEILKQPQRQIDPKEPLISSGLIDSISLVDLSLFVEENFGVLIDDTELSADTFDSLEELTTIIGSRQGS